MKRTLSFLLTLLMLVTSLPLNALTVFATGTETAEEASPLAGKTISILGASISTYAGTSNGAAAETTNSTIAGNVKYYPNTTIPEVTLEDTWWMQTAEDLGLRLLVNNAWSGSAILLERSGTVGAYVDRCVQLHDDTGDNAGEEPDIICIQMGFNDFSYGKDTLGNAEIDYDALITADGYGTPSTTMEATAIMLHKMTKRYPNAEIYMFNHFKRIGQSDSDTALMEELNASIETVCARYGVAVVDLYSNLTDPKHIGDGKLHPNRLGMDVITEAVKTAILENTKYTASCHTVSMELENVTADYGTDKLVMDGDSFALNLNSPDELQVTVTMDGKDVTSSVYADGAISIPAVTGDVKITAKGIHLPKHYRWEFNGTDLVAAIGGNALTKTAGTTADGVFSDTMYDLESPIVLRHDLPWQVEWKCQGTWKDESSASGGRLFTSTPVNAEYNARYLFKCATKWLIAMGEKTATGSHNYGIALEDYGIDGSALHTYRLENRIAADGSNMVYLFVDGEEIGAMNHYYVGTTDKKTTSDWLSGKDFTLPYFGTDTHGLTNCSIEYVEVWENIHPASESWPVLGTDLTHIICYGQSFSTGSDAPLYPDPSVEGVYVFGDITSGKAGDTLKTLEQITGTQHPVISAGNSLQQRLQQAGIDTDLILGSYGSGGKTIAQLMSEARQAEIKAEEGYDYDCLSSGRYEVFQASVSALADYAAAEGQTVSCPVIIYLQGETDQNTDAQLGYPENPIRAGYGAGGDKEKYKEYMTRLKEDMQKEVMEAYGQREKPLFLIYQVSGTYVRTQYSSINMAQLEFAQENDDVLLVQTPYFTSHYTGSHHLTVNGYRWLGEHIARTMYDALVDREKTYPLLPEEIAYESDNTIRITVSGGEGGLSIDTYTVENASNSGNLYGFTVYVNGKLICPESVTVTGDGILLTLPKSTLPLSKADSVYVYYGGKDAKGTGNIRDNCKEVGFYQYLDDSNDIGTGGNQSVSYSALDKDGNSLIGQSYPLYRWLASFCYELEIPAEEQKQGAFYHWELQDNDLVSVSGAQNELTLLEGTVENGILSGVQYAMEETVVLLHHKPWAIEWKAAGNGNSYGGGMLLAAGDGSGSGAGGLYLPADSRGMIAWNLSGKGRNCGIRLNAFNIDTRAEHIYRIENRISSDGTNTVYLLVDGVEMGDMNTAYSTSDGSLIENPGNWANGTDIYLRYLGKPTAFLLKNMKLSYLKVWENTELVQIPLGNFELGEVGQSKLTSSDVLLSQKSLITVPYSGATLRLRVNDGYQVRVHSGNNHSRIDQVSGWFNSDATYEYQLPADSIYMRVSIQRADGGKITVEELSAAGVSVSYLSSANILVDNGDTADILQETDLPVLIHLSDIHGDVIRAERAASFAEYVGADALLASGDLTAYQPADWGTALLEAFAKHPSVNILYGTGNHDSKNISSGKYEETIYSTYYKDSSLVSDGKTYYYRDLPADKLRIISANQQEGAASTSSGGTCFSQAQVDWLIDTLQSTPAGYGIVLMYHSPEVDPTGSVEEGCTEFYQADGRVSSTTSGYNDYTGTLLMDLIDAFMLRESICETYSEGNGASPVTVEADFANIADGVEFIAHVTGHVHADTVTYLPGTACKQLLLGVTCTTAMYGADGGYAKLADCSDLSRGGDTPAQDAFNAYLIDRENKTVRVLRIGATATLSGDVRDDMTIPYSKPFKPGEYLFDTEGLVKLDLSQVEWVNYGYRATGPDPAYQIGLRYTTNAVFDIPYDGVTFYVKINPPYELGIRSGASASDMSTNGYWLTNKPIKSGSNNKGYAYTVPKGHTKFILSLGNITRNCLNNATLTKNLINTLELNAAGVEIWYSPCAHTYQSTVTPPTCTEKGYTTYTCETCGDSYVADEVAANGHSYTSITTQPTATTQGYTTYTCEVCGDSYVSDYTDFTGFDSYEEAVKYLRKQMVARVPSITVRLYGVQLDENQVYNFRNDAWAHTGVPNEGDYIRQNCLTTSCSAVTGTDDKGIYTEMTFNTTWFTTAAQEAEVDAAVAEILSELNLWDATDYQKIKCAYDWVCTNVVYDHDNLYDSTYLLKHSSYAALIHRKAVCQGFATLFYRLCLELGVDCRVIIGYTDESHAWNIVKLGDKYYNMDPTYDRGTGNYYRYFLTTIYSFGGHDRNAEYETDAFNAAYPMATLPYVEKVAASGTLSNGMEWILDGDTGVLTVTGKGAIPDYRQWNAPWEPYSDSILGIELSEGITQVGDRAFAWCKNATYLSLPSTLKVICEYGFNNCRSLTEIDLPDGLTTLEFCAFSECSGLQSVYISAKLTNIGSSVFSNCPNIATIEFGEGFTHIADSMFSNTAVKELILPDTIVSIGSSAFARCEKLTYVRIPASVTYISHSAFINCSKLRQIGVVSDNPNYLSSFGVLFTKDAKTLVCFPAGMIPDRGTYTVPTGVTTIGDSAFYGASHVTRLVIPDSVTLIDDYAFAFCDGLYSVDIGPNVTRLGDTAFGFCTSLTSITFANPKMEIDNYCFTHCVKLNSFTFPAEIPALSPGILTDCHAITEIEIPKSVSVIGSGCFQFMKSLKKVTIPANITKLENCAFYNCTALEEVVIEGNLSFMDWSAFDTCSLLKFVHFKGSVASYATTTDRELFRDCPVLFAVYFDDAATAKKVTSATAFGNLCKNALTVAVPAGTTGLSSFITANYPIRSTVSKDGVAYDLYSKHNCSWTTEGYAVTVDCERRMPQYCSICRGKRDQISYVHSYGEEYFAPTCTEEGKYIYTCTVCGHSFEESIPAEGHYYDYVITDPTCTEEGRYDYFCLYCEHTYTESVPPLGHSYETWYTVTDATCAAEGTSRRDCANCEHYETNVIPATGHSYNAVVTEPTCTEQGYTTYTCHCGDSYVSDYTDPTGHSFSEWYTVKDATCTADGEQRRDCENCDHYETNTLPATGHSYNATVTPPTCTEQGYTTYTCHCGDSYVANYTDPTGHSFGEWYTVKEPTCTADGEQRRDCANCEHYETNTLPATGHSYTATVTPPTCTEKGYTTYTCHCGDSYVTDKTPATGHSFGQWYTVKEPTCTADGEQRRDCANCDHYETQAIPATGHSYNAIVTKPTCTEQGYTTYTCHCGDSYVADYIDPTGHAFGEWYTVKEPTCTADGEQRRGCENCEHYETQAIPATGHSYESVVTKPTCTEKGYTTYTCHCGDSYVADYIDPTGHAFGEWYTVKDATCTADGEQRRDCENCDHYETQAIPATGHSYNAVVTKPTCTERGYTTYTCHCGDSYVDNYVDATGHSFGAWETVKDATCTENGEQRRDCKNCDVYETKAIPATGHSYNAVVTEPTCTEKGYTTYTCHCGDSYVGNYVDATGHSFGEWYTAKEPTCTADGEQRRDCKNCDVYETKAIPATGHSYNAVVTKPTCTEKGYTTYACHCGDSYVDNYVDATGHAYGEWYTVKDATCTAKGMERRDCANCEHYETNVIPATGHSYESVVTKPTCTEQGYTTYTCHCGDSYVDNYVDATGHAYGEWYTVTEPTCITEGTERRDCANCEHYETNVLPATGHSYNAVVTNPTCTEQGYTTYTCHCGDSYVSDYTNPTGHSFGQWYTVKDATCTADGEQRRDCENCDHYETQAILATGHSYNAVVTKPTCTEQGYTTYTCHCGDSYISDYVDATGHIFGEWYTVKDTTCTENGTERRDCDNCDHYETQAIPATGHSYESVVTKPTCMEQGYTTYTCPCGDSYVADYIDATGHAYGEWFTVTAPTCTAEGTERRDCKNCDVYETKAIPATGHSYNAVITTPTCTEKGYTTYTCHCGDSYVDNYVDAKGHTFGEWYTVKEPTCTADGEQRRDCANCDHYETQAIPATGHSYTATVTPPTCTEQGYTTYTCHCGDSYVSDYVDASGHAFGQWYTVTAPTCTANGEQRRDCANCEHYETNTLPATGHSYNAVVTKPTCTEQGFTTYTCHCGDSYVADYTDPTGHSFGEWTTTKDATCTENGTERRDCANCDHYETQAIPALGHSLISHEAKAPTCTEIGWNAYETCARCLYTTYSELPATGHSYTATVTPPTCTESGFTTYTCHCGVSYASNFRSPLGHTWDEGVITLEPTEETEGVKLYTCIACGETKEVILPTIDHVHHYEGVVTKPTCTEQGYTTYTCRCEDSYVTDYVPATGHSYESVVTEPTCTEQGYTTYTCRCGDSYVTNYTDPTGHTYGEWYTVNDATCTESGSERRDCANCEHYETQAIPATGHSYGSVVTEPTCTEKGYTTYTCHCGDSHISDYVDATGHTFDQWYTVKEPSCTAEGTERRDCANCEHYETQAIPATGHSYNAVVTEPTCTKKGYTTYTCHCGDSYISDYVDATGHTFGEWYTVKDATCTENGAERRDCANCEHYETNVLPATGHSYNAVVTTPTCTEKGYTTYTCHCGDSYVADYTDPTGHTFGKWTTTKDATCTENGTERRNCENCEHYETNVLPATGHSYESVVTKPTCTEQGYTTYTCHCGDSYVADYVDATGHSFGEWYTVTEPTCITEGTERRDCANCDHYETNVLPATGHSYTATVTPPTCTEKGYTTYTCHCGDSYVTDYTDPTGHSFGQWYTVKEPTCTADGEQRRDCANCDHYETNVLPATGHSYESVVTEPTCTEKGYTTYTCHCGDNYVGNHTPAVGHAWDSGVVTLEPTEETEGVKLYTCTVCGETKTESIPTLDHVHRYESVVTEPTCTEKGYTTYTCHCGDSYVSDYTNPTGHSFGEWHTVTAPTCTADGEQRRDCANCDHYETSVLPATGHSYQATVTQPTCTEQGYTTYTCHCGDSYASDYVDPVGHAWSDWQDAAPGKEERSCTACGETESRDKIPDYDVDGNGVVEEADAKLLLAILVGNAEAEVLHDFDFDGKLTIYDCVLLMQQLS